jgi:uncharacterized protein
MILIISLAFMLLSWIVSSRLKSKFEQYSQIMLRNHMTGYDAARKMLDDHRLYNVQITCVNLSEEVYYGRNAAAVAVAAHECGHAVQHATAYSMLEFRSAMVPVQNISGTVMTIISLASLFGGYFLFRAFPYDLILMVIIGCNLVMTTFAFVTLPVEFDASRRALAWVTERRVVTSEEYDMAKDALKWAALTYVVAALSALTSLLYYLWMFFGRNDD